MTLSSQTLDDVFGLDGDSIRVLIFLEILARARVDFIIYLRKIFGETWEFKILDALLKHGPMNKSKLAFLLFGSRGRHYKLSRRNPVYTAFNRLLIQKIIIQKNNLYDVNAGYKLILQRLLLE